MGASNFLVSGAWLDVSHHGLARVARCVARSPYKVIVISPRFGDAIGVLAVDDLDTLVLVQWARVHVALALANCYALFPTVRNFAHVVQIFPSHILNTESPLRSLFKLVSRKRECPYSAALLGFCHLVPKFKVEVVVCQGHHLGFGDVSEVERVEYVGRLAVGVREEFEGDRLLTTWALRCALVLRSWGRRGGRTCAWRWGCWTWRWGCWT